jgi:hypothetical protein
MSSLNRFYFHVWAEDSLYKDSEGVELSDLHAAWRELIRVDHELRSEPPGIFNVWFEVADGDSRTVLVMPVGGRHGYDQRSAPSTLNRRSNRACDAARPRAELTNRAKNLRCH